MSLSWSEIRKRAIEFSKEWKNETREMAESKTFWDSFFNVFGISRRRLASFEEPVKKLNNKYGFIDLFWKGTLIVEHKSKGKNLEKAYSQALDYFIGLSDEELPKYILVSDFSKFRLYDLDNNSDIEFPIKDLYKHMPSFNFMQGNKKEFYKEETVVNVKASELMGQLHDLLYNNGYTGHKLEVFLVRIMFCLFAEDTDIFLDKQFLNYILEETKEDGTDVGMYISSLFQILNLNYIEREKIVGLSENLKAFQYINGSLFKEDFNIAIFSKEMREMLIKCCKYDWSQVSPVIFGSLFQSVMDKSKRNSLGAHYTSEENILKVINDTFLYDYYNEFEKATNNKKALNELLNKIYTTIIFDPACGCGNFLIVAYRELRQLEINIYLKLRELSKLESQFSFKLNIDTFKLLDVDSMYGIEIEEFPARIAQVALWLIDHQMNEKFSILFSENIVRLPLKKSANITVGNSLVIDWNSIIDKNKVSYIIGNPPFVAKKNRVSQQNEDMKLVCGNIENYGLLDYVCSWYIKAVDYIRDTKIKIAFVSTNSISQGEQVGVLWKYLLSKNIVINFAHKTFKWNNEAKGSAQVHVIIIGFSYSSNNDKYLYEYDNFSNVAMQSKVKNINPYLIEAENTIINKRTNPISNVPKISFGNMPNDNGYFLFTNSEKKEFLDIEPLAFQYIKPFISAKEFLHDESRWCLWLDNISSTELKHLPEITKRIAKVKDYRLKSSRATTNKLADYPYMFGEIRQPKGNYIVIPLHSSENRKYIPLGYFDCNYIVNNSCSIIENASLYHFGVLSSYMHMVWVKSICGRIKSDYRYSNSLVYNNFPWANNVEDVYIKRVENIVKELFLIREELKESTLADLYNPLLMPKRLLDIHKKLDRAVELCYRKQSFTNDSKRLEFLFELYDKYIKTS